MARVEWTPLAESELPELVALARQCLAADGGLPQLGDEDYLRAMFLHGDGIGGRDDTGELVAAGAVYLDGELRRTATGLVHPAMRRQGIGYQIVQWCRERADGAPLRVAIENVSDSTDDLFAELDLVRVFAETVMRHPLTGIPVVKRPAGVHLRSWTPQTRAAFHAAYRASFAERPGFPDTPLERWVGFTEDDPGFRPRDSKVAVTDDGEEPVGFVTLSDCWIDQVGTSPSFRGRRLGAHLVARSLTRLRRRGCASVWLAVGVDNPAAGLYERLGFAPVGLRARYEEPPAPAC